MQGIIIMLSVLSVSAIVIAYIADRQVKELKEMYTKLDEILSSKILADINGKYNGYFTPVKSEVIDYRKWRGNDE